ncbi:MAG: Ca2+-dependent phosphoinositide-specific phospholipase C, partial [Oleiharenicola lentus]
MLALSSARLLAATDWEAASAAPGVRLNQIQVIGTHNSYHLEPPAQAVAWKNSDAVRRAEPRLADLAVKYGHVPLTEQLDRLGVRQIEIDVYPSRDGKDFPVLHHPVFDERSTVPTLGAALREVRAWSAAHPRHVPVLVQIELKIHRPPVLDETA